MTRTIHFYPDEKDATLEVTLSDGTSQLTIGSPKDVTTIHMSDEELVFVCKTILTNLGMR